MKTMETGFAAFVGAVLFLVALRLDPANLIRLVCLIMAGFSFGYAWRCFEAGE